MQKIQEMYENIILLEKKQNQRMYYQRWLDLMRTYKYQLTTPITVEIGVTKTCNQNCMHCSNGGGRKNGFLNLNLLDEILKINPGYVILTGGEPFLHPEFYEIVHKVKDSHAFLRICTNGTLIDVQKHKKLLSLLDKDDIVQISLDASDKIAYSKMRGKDDFEKVIANIRVIKEKYPWLTIEVHNVPTQYNINEVEKIYELVNEEGVDYFSIAPLAYLGNACGLEKISILTLLKLHYNLLQKMLTFKTKYIGRPYEIASLYKQINICSKEKVKATYSCAAGYESIYIDCFGKVFPCVYMQTDWFDLGKITDGIESIMDTCKKKIPLEIEIKNTPCDGCYMWKICRGGCLGLSFFQCGKCLPGFDPRCAKVIDPPEG